MSKENLSLHPLCYLMNSYKNTSISSHFHAASVLMAFTYYSVVSDFFVSSLYVYPKGEQIAYLHLLDSQSKGDEARRS